MACSIKGLGLSVVFSLTLAHASILRAPKENLLQASRDVAVSNSSTVAVDASKQPFDQSFFTKDAEKMDELPNYDNKNPKNKCHPKCKWTCGTTKCNNKCQVSFCAPPKCVTACKKPTMAKCKRVCKDPQCAVVCPPQCEHGACPKCKTVCGASICALQCGDANRCESQCADPDCKWACKADLACAKPECKMKCDTSVCSFGKDQKLPSDADVPYMGQEVAWKGLGKIPAENLAAFAPKSFSKPLVMKTGAKLLKGAKPMPKGGIKSITGDTGIVSEATVTKGVSWTNGVQQAKTILAPSR